MTYIKLLTELSNKDVAIAGGKGASLGELMRADISVPNGFVVLTGSFDKFLDGADLRQEIRAQLNKVDQNKMHTVERASERIQLMILRAEMPKNIAQAITKDFSTLGAEYVAVRSSATAEDSDSAAWAGQLDTYLNTTKGTLLENVKKCWASLFTPRAIFYRFEKGLKESNVSVAIVVQERRWLHAVRGAEMQALARSQNSLILSTVCNLAPCKAWSHRELFHGSLFHGM